MLARLAQGRLYYGWIIVLTLSITQLTSWGILYYGFSVIMPAMQRDAGLVTGHPDWWVLARTGDLRDWSGAGRALARSQRHPYAQRPPPGQPTAARAVQA